MAKGVFMTKVAPSYRDIPEVEYHFPRAYLSRVEQTLGDRIIYYEPRRLSDGDETRGGRQAYFAMAEPVAIRPDPDLADHFYCSIRNYIDFVEPVRFREGARYWESALQKDDGSTNKGAFGHSVRLLPEAEFAALVAAGFPSDAVARWTHDSTDGLGPIKRPLIELTTLRPFRDRAFRRSVRQAYDGQCAMTGLRLIGATGNSEVQAAHIRGVAHKGSDSIRNGLALSGTIHWLFDEGLLSVDDDRTILKAKKFIPPEIDQLINSDGLVAQPKDPAHWPHPSFLAYHRDNIFVG
jgi:Predicted restriction endonuclease